MVDLLNNAAVQPVRIQREHAEHHKSHVADRGIRHKLLHIRLHHRNQSAVDDGDDRQRDHHRNEVDGRPGKNRNAESQKSIRSHLQQNGSQDYRSCRWGFHVGIGKPGMEWEHRNLDRESNKECQENPVLKALRQIRADRMQRHDIKRRQGAENTPISQGAPRRFRDTGSKAPECPAASGQSPPACTGRT